MPTILVVEDESVVRRALVRMLQRHYRVLEAATAQEGLAVCQDGQGPIDLVITDITMPGMDGPTFTRQFSNHCRNSLVLFISGHPEDELAKRGLLPENLPILYKPFTTEVLVARTK